MRNKGFIVVVVVVVVVFLWFPVLEVFHVYAPF